MESESRTKGLPIDCYQLRPRTPIPVRLIIARGDSHSLRVYPDQMRSTMFNEILHTTGIALEHAIGSVLGEREHVLWSVDFFLINPAILDANSIHKK